MDVRIQRAVVIPAAILCLAFVVRAGAGWWWQRRLAPDKSFWFGDSESYWSLGRAIAQGSPYEYGPGSGKVFRTPGYPCLLAPLFLVRNEPPVLWARLEGAVFGTLSVGGVIYLGWRLFDAVTGYTAGLLAALYPGAIGASVFVLSEAPYCPLLVAEVVCWVTAWEAPTRKRLAILAVVAGAIHGMATLMRPSHLLFVPFALAVAMVSAHRRRHILIGIFILAASCATLAPWWWRNYQVTGRFVATTLQLGASLYDGWNPHATGASDMQFVEEFVAIQRQVDAHTSRPVSTFEERLDERLKQSALAWARSNPQRVLELAGLKLARMWSPLPNAADMQSWLFRLAIFCSFTPLFGLAILGSIRCASRGWPLAMCWLPAVYLTCLHLIFVSSIRYREPAMLPLMVLAARAVACRGSRQAAAETPLSASRSTSANHHVV